MKDFQTSISPEEMAQARIWVVDDEPANVRLLEKMLARAGYENVRSTNDPCLIPGWCKQEAPDLLLLDLMMPVLDGFGLMREVAPLLPGDGYSPILVLTADATPATRNRALREGAKDFVTKPFDASEVLLRIRNLLETRFLYARLEERRDDLEAQVRARTRELEQAQNEVLERLARASECRDDDTGQHTQRVGQLVGRIAREMGLNAAQAELLERTAPLHDVGKIGVPDCILLKPGRLEPAEFDTMKTHTLVGERLLSGGTSELVQLAEQIALTHHERWDGSGYPRGLSGEDIPLPGRIVSLADVFDALTHERPYKTAWSEQDAIAEIQRQSGRQFDPAVVEAFLRVLSLGF